jgi:ornithine cyclodeaminase/alanine dehydrogenase-like protein (mu-crystallin family)
MAEIIHQTEIERILPRVDLVNIMEQGFAAYSRGEVTVPPPGELLFDDPPGDVHIKYGYIHDDDYYVIKVASGFYRNPDVGLPSSQGLMLLFSRHTGVLTAILLDEGRLTDVRTAAAGAVVAKHLAPNNIECIGIIGAGIQARLQLLHLLQVVKAKKALVWAPDKAEFADYKAYFAKADVDIEIEFTQELRDIPRTCKLIVTTTPSKIPLLKSVDIRPGTHVTAIGSDTPEKTEIEAAILARADILVVDSLAQSKSRGEVFRAVQSGTIDRSGVIELGLVVTDPQLGRQNDEQLTLADLTGVAVQDIQIAKAVYQERMTLKGS